jgi:hypothetical protein
MASFPPSCGSVKSAQCYLFLFGTGFKKQKSYRPSTWEKIVTDSFECSGAEMFPAPISWRSQLGLN